MYKSKEEAYDRILENNAKWRENNYDIFRLSNILLQAKNRAIKHGLPYDLDIEWFKHKALVVGKCEVTGISFNHAKPFVKNKRNPFGASVDRINPEKGYTKDNCRVVCWIHNRAKGDDDLLDLYYYCKALVKAIEGE